MVKCRRMKRLQFKSENWIHSWLWKLCVEHRYSYEWINGQKPHLISNGIQIQCNRENFVPIVVPGLSTSSSSSFPSSTSMTPSRQEIDHLTSSLSSSTSPTVTSSAVSCDSETRARRDPCGIDPAASSSKHVERQERGNLCSSEIPEEELLQEFRENLVDDGVPEHRDSHASYSHESSLKPQLATIADLGEHSVETHFPEDRNCEICQEDQNYKGPMQKTQWWKPCLVLKKLVIW